MPRFWVPFVEGMVRVAKGGDLRDLGSGVRAAWANCLMPLSNEYYPVRKVEGSEHLAEMFAEAKEDGAKRQLPWIFLVPNHGANELPFAETDAVARAAGLEPLMDLDEMTGDAGRLAPPRRQLADVELQRIQTRSQEAAAWKINIAAYGMPEEFLPSTLEAAMLYQDPQAEFGYLALVDGVPAATACVVMLDGWLYVAAVATHVDYRRRGFADVVMRRALEEAQQASGITQTALDASAMGRPVYEAMGYEVTGEVWRVYALPH